MIFRWSILAVLVCLVFSAILCIPALQSTFDNPGIVVKLLSGVLGVWGALAASILWLGMMLYALASYRHSVIAKILWMVAFLTVNILAALIYYLLVYIREPMQLTTQVAWAKEE